MNPTSRPRTRTLTLVYVSLHSSPVCPPVYSSNPSYLSYFSFCLTAEDWIAWPAGEHFYSGHAPPRAPDGLRWRAVRRVTTVSQFGPACSALSQTRPQATMSAPWPTHFPSDVLLTLEPQPDPGGFWVLSSGVRSVGMGWSEHLSTLLLLNCFHHSFSKRYIRKKSNGLKLLRKLETLQMPIHC